MPAVIHITSSAVISRHRVFKNGLAVFENKETDLPGFLISVYRYSGINYPKFYKMDNLSKLGFLASEVLLKDSIEEATYKPEDVGVILNNASSSLDTDLKYFESAKDIASPALFVYTLPNIVIGEICIKHKFKGENAFFIFEAFDADFMQKYVSNLINNDTLQACVCGWVELLAEEYKAVLFLVEKESSLAAGSPGQKNPSAIIFTKENLDKIYHLQDG